MPITYDRERITPTQAKEYLEVNENNRHLSANGVAALASAIKRGEWVENAQPICFDTEGHLIDGQHRLAAIAAAKKTVTTTVARGLDPAAQETIDIGKARSVSDMLTLRGYTNTAALSAVATGLVAYAISGGTQLRVVGGTKPSPQQIIARVVEGGEHLEEVAKWSRQFQQKDASLQLGALAGTLRVLFAEAANDDSEAVAFFEGLLAPPNTTGPQAVLRRKLQKIQQANHSVPHKVKAALVIKAWNAYILGESPSKLVYFPGGKRKEKFPRIAGPEG